MTDLSSPSTSSTFLARVRHRDADAWRSFATVYGPCVYGWVRASGLNEHDAADKLAVPLISGSLSFD